MTYDPNSLAVMILEFTPRKEHAMSTEAMTGLFVIGGAIVGGLFSYLSARIGHDWDKAKSDIRRLSDQVAAYHKVEELYKQKVAALDPTAGSPKTVLQLMRDEVQALDGFVRRSMSANEAMKIQDRWT